MGVFCSLAIMDIRGASDLIRHKALKGRKYIKITDATVRPFLHLLNPPRRPRQESFSSPLKLALHLGPALYATRGSTRGS